MTEARVQRLHTPLYSEQLYPPLPPRIRLAAESWERVWWLTLIDPITDIKKLDAIAQDFNDGAVNVRAQMRTCRRLCFAVTTRFLDEQREFEVAMSLMSEVQKQLGQIERVEDRAVDLWPIHDFY